MLPPLLHNKTIQSSMRTSSVFLKSIHLVFLFGFLLVSVSTSQIQVGPPILIEDPLVQPVITDPVSTDPAPVTPIAAPVPIIVNPYTQYTLCDAKIRPQMCTADYQPVCAYIKDCIGGSCTKTMSNACSACSDKSVQAYFNGACKKIETKCVHSKALTMCPALYSPVCALALNCQGPDCTRTASNSCSVCNIDGVDRYLPGQCPPKPEDSDKIAYCDSSSRPQICTLIYKPVCGVKTNCFGSNCRKPFSNACRACSSSQISYYVDGDCRRY